MKAYNLTATQHRVIREALQAIEPWHARMECGDWRTIDDLLNEVFTANDDGEVNSNDNE